MRDDHIFNQIANAYLIAGNSFTSPWPLILPALVHALIWLVQVIGCAVDSLVGETLYTVCREPVFGQEFSPKR